MNKVKYMNNYIKFIRKIKQEKTRRRKKRK